MNQKPYEVPTEMREFAEKSVEQARKAVEGFMGAAHKSVTAAEDATHTAQASARDFGSKTLGYAEANIAAAFDLAQKLVRAKDLQEAMSIQAEFARAQMANLQEQAKEIGGMVQKAAASAAETVKKK